MNTYNEAELNTLKLADITDLYNQLATVTGDKPVKKFRDKPTAVKRTVAIQEIAAPYMDVEPESNGKSDDQVALEKGFEKLAETKKPAKKAEGKGNSKTDMNAKVEIAKARENKEGSIADAVFTAVIELGNPTVQELTDHIVETYTKPRSNVPVTHGFVVSTIRYFLTNEGTLKFS